MTTENVKKGVLAIGLSPELDAFVKRAAEKAGCAAAHMGRVATIEAAARILGEPAPEVLESKKGPKAGGKLTPLAEKFALSNAELARRVSALVKQGFDVKKLKDYDFSVDPAPIKHRAPKADAQA